MKLFHFYRSSDVSGVSGTGPVVEGVEFSNGWCALRWISEMSSLCFYRSLTDVKRIHGHGGGTEIIIHDFQPLQRQLSGRGKDRFDRLVEVIDEVARITVLAEEPDLARETLEALERARAILDELEASLPSAKKPA